MNSNKSVTNYYYYYGVTLQNLSIDVTKMFYYLLDMYYAILGLGYVD